MDPLVSDIASIIQLAVAPVFLLAGIAGFLNVMSGRLGRIIDRARVVERRVRKLTTTEDTALANKELKVLWRRVAITNWSIALCTAAALLVCTLIASLFIGGHWKLELDGFIVFFFVLALFFLIAALLLFLKEIQLATKTLRGGSEYFDD
jgi:hypothetical protein